ncbi:hypothetical protein BON22_3722 [Cyberlindnera fabianii]|uniref:F-box domain-containing protein n=1 Tax=Cyberlindnera fabianii TaxID=36022 RepID=A0A1V2L3Q0_CYBFA|nr:hypothetical protein BON22_3722 [Cyberlindnera fabianii]
MTQRLTLLDLPNEILFKILYQLTDIKDLASLAQVPEIKREMAQFVRVVLVPGEKRITYLDEVFHGFPVSSFADRAPELSINLCEWDVGRYLRSSNEISTVSLVETIRSNILSQCNIRNFLFVSRLSEIGKFSDVQTEAFLIQGLIEPLLKDRRFVITFLSKTIRMRSTDLTDADIKLPNITEMTMQDVNGEPYHEFQKLQPRNLSVYGSTRRNWTSVIDTENIEKIFVQSTHMAHTGEFLTLQSRTPSPDPFTLRSHTFANLKDLSLASINCLCDLTFPLLENLTLQITPFSETTRVVVPIISNISAPSCAALWVSISTTSPPELQSKEFPYILPLVERINMPQLTVLEMRITPTTLRFGENENSHNENGDRLAYMDWEETFGINGFDRVGCTCDHNDENEAMACKHGWPSAGMITMSGATAGMKLGPEFLGQQKFFNVSFRDQGRVPSIGVELGKMHLLHSINVTDLRTKGEMLRVPSVIPKLKNSLRFLQIHRLGSEEDEEPVMSIDFPEIAKRFPDLHALDVCEIASEDVVDADLSLVFNDIHLLVLQNSRMDDILEFLESFKAPKLEALEIIDCIKPRLDFEDTPTLLRRFKGCVEDHFAHIERLAVSFGDWSEKSLIEEALGDDIVDMTKFPHLTDVTIRRLPVAQ